MFEKLVSKIFGHCDIYLIDIDYLIVYFVCLDNELFETSKLRVGIE